MGIIHINMIIAIHVGLVLLALLVFAVGLFLPKTKSAQRVVEFNAVPEEIWRIVTEVEQQPRWRTNLKKVEILERTPEYEVWTEYPANGAPLTFKMLKKRPFDFYEMEIARSTVFSGRRIIELDGLSIDVTRVTIAEQAEIKNPFMRVLAHLSFDFGRTIDRYVKDLASELTRKQEKLESQTS
jgi:Polyketide cyclase / dehydrase and lipid transport